MRIKELLVFTIVLFAQSSSWAQYNEMYDNNGQLRPQYRGAMQVLSQVTPAQEKDYVKRSNQAFKKDNSLSLTPRIILGTEYDQMLDAGYDQRARALRAFLKDYFSQQKKYLQVISEDTLKRIVERNHDSKFLGQVNPDDIDFPYGPDIIKDSSGQWRVIEDNPGAIGGPGDLELAQNFLFENHPDLMDHVNARDPNVYYQKLAAYYKNKAAAHGGKAIMLMSKYTLDNEDNRVVKILKRYGIETVYPSGRTQLYINESKGGGVYTYDSQKGKRDKATGRSLMEKVGCLVMNGEHHWFDSVHPGNWDHWVGEQIAIALEDEKIHPDTKKILRAIQRDPVLANDPDATYDALKRLRLLGELKETRSWTPYNGLTQKILSGEVGTNYTPGIDFIGDKEFYTYVEDFIRLYLGENPILKNIETKRFAADKGFGINDQVMEDILKNKNSFVIKKVDGRGGDAVWVGAKMNKTELNQLVSSIRSDPENYIAQKFTSLSVLKDYIVDARVLGQVGSQEVIVSNVPWGRGLPQNGNGKVNLSGDGIEITILIHDEPTRKVMRCENLLL
jgi:uncharacterized circularly permuted ATP-grasp superfamily protein